MYIYVNHLYSRFFNTECPKLFDSWELRVKLLKFPLRLTKQTNYIIHIFSYLLNTNYNHDGIYVGFSLNKLVKYL